MKTEYQTITFADITLTPDAQIAIKSIQNDEDKVICNNLNEVALHLCEEHNDEKASKILDWVHSVLLVKNYLSLIMTKEYED